MTAEDKGADREERLTPYELVFGGPAFDESRFERVRDQAQAAGALSPGSLLLQPAAGELLRELLPPPDRQTGASHQAVVAEVGALLFHAFRFWLHGRCVYELPPAVLSAGLGEQPEWSFRAPAGAGYVQLPHQLFWARVAEDVPPEPVDGFFWSAPWLDAVDSAPTGDADRLDLLLVLGLRRGRPGLSLVDIAVEPAERLEQWAALRVRPDGEDFANILPGGELQGYRALTTRAEALKLATICFRIIDNNAVSLPVDGAVRRFRVDG